MKIPEWLFFWGIREHHHINKELTILGVTFSYTIKDFLKSEITDKKE